MNVIISVVTINYNDAVGLENTLLSYYKSLSGFTDKVELIVVDGGSTDHSVDVIYDNSCFINRYVSEPDNGIYDAMNKGISLSRGDSIIFMNSGDMFHADFSFSEFLDYVNKNNLDLTDYIVAGHNLINFGNLYFYRRIVDGDIPCHQAMFVPKRYLLDGFDCDFKICADYKKNKSLIDLHGYVIYNGIICINMLGGISNQWPTFSILFKHYKEVMLIDEPSIYKKIKIFISMFIKKMCIDILGVNLYYGIYFSVKNK